MLGKRTDKDAKQLELERQFEEGLASKYGIVVKRILPIVVLSLVVDILGFFMIMPLLPQYVLSFGASDFMIGVIVSANALTSMIFGPVWGRLSDKYGRKPILIISQVGTLVSFGILAMADSTMMLLFSRLLDGMFGGQIPTINAVLSDISRPETRSEKMAFMGVAMVIGTVLGPMIGGYLGSINMAYPAYAATFMAGVAIITSIMIFPETMPEQRRKDLRAQFHKVDENGNVESIFNRTVKLRLAQMFGTTMMFGLMMSGMSLILDRRYNSDLMTIGNLAAMMGVISFIIGMGLMRPLNRRLGENKILFGAITLFGLAYIIYPFMDTITGFYFFMVLLVSGSSLSRPVVRSRLARAVKPSQQGAISGYSTTVRSLAQTVAPLITTGWLQIGVLKMGGLSLDYNHLIGISGVLFVAMLAVLVFLDREADEPVHFENLNQR
ncbi:MFS transporter [Candidatus Bathyarchaeota archaeon]|nr:MFS transporter [Candidatus Bathyarchaeota archaeon]